MTIYIYIYIYIYDMMSYHITLIVTYIDRQVREKPVTNKYGVSEIDNKPVEDPFYVFLI